MAKKAKKARSDAPRKVGSTGVRQIQPNYWKRVKRELHILICTNNRRYETLRRYIGKENKTTQVALVSAISASIGAHLGMTATVIGPFVTLGLMALLQVGKNAWCAGQSMT